MVRAHFLSEEVCFRQMRSGQRFFCENNYENAFLRKLKCIIRQRLMLVEETNNVVVEVTKNIFQIMAYSSRTLYSLFRAQS